MGDIFESFELVCNAYLFCFSGRPASLILAKGECPIFKISRSYSFDNEDESAGSGAVEMANDDSPSRDESQPLVK